MKKYVRLVSLWGVAFFTLAFAGPQKKIEPIAFGGMTQASLERVFIDQNLDPKLAKHLYALCLKNRFDPAFILSVIQVESSFRPSVVSSAGAIGLMQIMPQTARVVARRNRMNVRITKKALTDPFLNLTLGVTYLRELRERYAGMSPYFHLAAYNIGPHRLDQLRARPDFRPAKTWKYYQNVMKGVKTWRYYGPEVGVKEAAVQSRGAKVKQRSSSA